METLKGLSELDAKFMTDMDHWLLWEELTIAQAALLMSGNDPSQEHSYVEGWPSHKRPSGYEAAKQALVGAIRKGKVIGILTEGIVPVPGDPYNDMPEPALSMTLSVVDMDSLREWLRGKGVKNNPLLPVTPEAPEYLQKGKPRYAPKLAAAVHAWEATRDQQGRHPKQALMKWLREHAAEFGLCDDDGNPSENVIDEIAKVANWQLSGGAPQTPVARPSPNKTRANSSY